MLHVAFEELPTRGAEEVLARRPGSGVEEGGGVLQLIAKSIGAARLVVAAAAPVATGEGLILEPSVDEQVEGGIGSLGMDNAEGAFPEFPDAFESPVRAGLAAVTTNEIFRFVSVAAGPDEEDDFFFLPACEVEGDL